jgi:hypothetical protein
VQAADRKIEVVTRVGRAHVRVDSTRDLDLDALEPALVAAMPGAV